MADVDSTGNPPNTDPNKAVEGLRTELDQKLGQVTELLKAMNAQNAASYQQLAQAITPKPAAKPQFTDDDLYNPGKLQSQVESVANQVASSVLLKERSINAKIAELTQEYPEIQTDPDTKKAVLQAHNNLPKHLVDTAEGYEMAILKAVTEAGIVKKSKRAAVDVEEPIAAGSRGASASRARSSGSKGKVDDNMRAFAELMGRPVDDPDYQKRLEEHASRDTYTKYR